MQIDIILAHLNISPKAWTLKKSFNLLCQSLKKVYIILVFLSITPSNYSPPTYLSIIIFAAFSYLFSVSPHGDICPFSLAPLAQLQVFTCAEICLSLQLLYCNSKAGRIDFPWVIARARAQRRVTVGFFFTLCHSNLHVQWDNCYCKSVLLWLLVYLVLETNVLVVGSSLNAKWGRHASKLGVFWCFDTLQGVVILLYGTAEMTNNFFQR